MRKMVNTFAAMAGAALASFDLTSPDDRPYTRQPGAGVLRAKKRESAFRAKDKARLINAMAVTETRQMRRFAEAHNAR